MPADYKAVLDTLQRSGDFNDGVLKVNVPRADLKVTIQGRPAPTPFGFGGWIALTNGTGGHDVLMGDLVLTEDEVNPVMSAVLTNGLDVTALHSHFFWEQPRIYYMHVRDGHGRRPHDTREACARHDPQAAGSGARRAATAQRQALSTAPPLPAPSDIRVNRPACLQDRWPPGSEEQSTRAVINAESEHLGRVRRADADAMVAGDVAMLELN